MSEINLQHHAYAVDVSGYTIMPGQVRGAELELLREGADRALARSLAVREGGGKLRHTFTHQYYNASRCMYCWGDACVRLLEHPAIQGLASAVMDGGYRLWDQLVMAALPAPVRAQGEATTAWHRDFEGMFWGAPTPGYLWCNVCLDDMTPENGATWVVPGSHKRGLVPEPARGDGKGAGELYPTKMQVSAKAGDIVVFNPAMLHDSGHNRTNNARRLLNVGLCHRTLQPLMNHWKIAGEKIRQGASEQVREMLNAGGTGLDETWGGLPEGWTT